MDAEQRPAGEVSPWIQRFSPLVAAGGEVLDVAAGGGRHTRWFLARGHRVVAVDRDTRALASVAGHPDLEVVQADLESGSWPFEGRRFAGVVVTNYLHRPLLPALVASVAGVLLYETFAVGQERFGRPRDPEFLLRPHELLDAVRGELRVVAYEDVLTPRPSCVQRLAAVREPGPT
jgi:SAM-dependent methyltransferase